MGILDWFKRNGDGSDQTASTLSTPLARPKLERFNSETIDAKLAQRGIATVVSAAEVAAKNRVVKAEWTDRMQDPVESLIASECEAFAKQNASNTETLLRGYLDAAGKLRVPDVGSSLEYYLEETRRRWESGETLIKESKESETSLKDLKGEYRDCYARYEQLKRELRNFRKQHGLLRKARATTWQRQVLFWGIFFVLFAVETFLNAQFFEDYSDGGLLGGWVNALVISMVNVLISTLIGMKVAPRALYGPGVIDRLWSIPVFALYVCVIVLFNFGAGHYRALLGASLPSSVAQQAAFDQLVNAPFELSGLASLLLVLFGLFTAVVAWIDGYVMWDEPFPTYGDKVRALNQSYLDALDCNKEIVDCGSNVVSEVIGSIAAAGGKVDAAIRECSSIEQDIAEMQNTALLNEKEINSYHEQLTHLFRNTVTKFIHVDDKPPQFFSAGIPRISDRVSNIDFPGAKQSLAERKTHLGSLHAILGALEQNSKPDLSGEVQRLADRFFFDVAPYYMVILLKGQKHGCAIKIEWRHLDTFLDLRYELSFEDVARGAALLRLPRTRVAGKREDVESARASDEALGVTLEVDTWPPKTDEGNRCFPNALSKGIQGKDVGIPQLLNQNS